MSVADGADDRHQRVEASLEVSAASDWRNGSAYDYFNDLDPEKIAYKFLRRNDKYVADYTTLADDQDSGDPPSALTRWGLRFAVDPRLRADQATIIWLPALNPRLALLTHLPPTLCEGASADGADPSPIVSAAEGEYLELLALPPVRGALLLSAQPHSKAIAFVLPFDGLFEDRLDAARRLHRLLITGRGASATLTPYRRQRLKLALRALDGSLDGADYRTIAEALFGDRVPTGAAFRDNSLRGQVIRFVRYGVELMRGGYLDLLRPERRAPKRLRSSRRG